MSKGRIWEYNVVGLTVTRNWDQRHEWTLSEMLDEAKAHQHPQWDPTDPPKRIANDFHALVCECLGVDDYARVRLYQGIGGPLDRFGYGDMFLEYRGQVCTIDLTRRHDKEEASIIRFGPDDNLKEIAQEVAIQLLRE